MRIIAVRFENHSRRFSIAEVHKPRMTMLCPEICSYSVWYNLHVDIPMEEILMRLLQLRKVLNL